MNDNVNWIDEYITRVRPYIFVREEDNVLIKRPNTATKINAMGTKILLFLLNGGTIQELIQKVGDDKTNEIIQFMCAVKKYTEGKLNELNFSPAVNKETFSKNFSEYPILSELAITYRCNLKCRFCYAGCNTTCNPINSKDELEYSDFKKLIDKIKDEAKVPSISFTGGEPTLRKKMLLKLIAYAKKKDFRINLITNGTLINKHFAMELAKAGLDSVQVSIEGTREGTHDLLVGQKGSFDKSIAAIFYLKQQGIYTHTNTTLCKTNLQDALNMPEFIKEKLQLPKFSMNLIIPAGSSNIFKDIIIPYSEVGKYIQKIMDKSQKHGVEFMWYSPVPMCMFNPVVHGLGNKGCSACDGLISVAPNGDLLPCASYDDPVGNLLDNSFKELWHSSKGTTYRNKEKAHPDCQGCEDFFICNGACPLYWRSQGYSELEKIFQNHNQHVSIIE